MVASVSGTNIPAYKIAEELQINRRTAEKGKKKRKKYDQAEDYISLIIPATIKRIRIAPSIQLVIIDWIEQNTVPSTKQENIVTWTENGIKKQHALHYRCVSLDDLYFQFNEAHPSLSFSSSYFYNCLPEWLSVKVQRSGLCIYHDKAVRLVRILISNRSKWHLNCTCDCNFCR